MTFTTDDGYPELVASIVYPDLNKHYILDNCGHDCHVLKVDGTDPSKEVNDEDDESRALLPKLPLSNYIFHDKANVADRQSLTIIHVTVWYNPIFWRLI